MKIAFILPSLANTGPIIVSRDIVNNLIDSVEKIDIYYFHEIKELDFKADTYKISFFEQIDFNKYDIIHSHCIVSDAYLFINRNKIRTKMVTTLHNYVRDEMKYQYNLNLLLSFLYSAIWNLMVSRHDKIVVLSKHMQKYYERFLISKKITYIYNGRNIPDRIDNIDTDTQIILKNLKNKYKIIGVIGSLTKRKGIDQLIKFLKLGQDYMLVIIGDGREKDFLTKLGKNLNVENRLLFLGYQKSVMRFFEYFDICAIPSRSEGFPLVLIEAASMKKAVVLSNLPVFQEIFDEHEVSYFELENIDSLKTAIDKAIYDKDKYETNIHKKYITHYTVTIMATSYLKLYHQLINQV